jgi:hypothetical protein
MPRTKKTATDVKIDQLVTEVKELRMEMKQINRQVNFGRGVFWVLIFLGSIATGLYNLFTR